MERCGQALEGPHIIVSLVMQTLGLLGFGEAGFHFARGLRGAGAAPLVAFDIKAPHGIEDDRIRTRAAETDTRLVASPRALAEHAQVILSVVTAASAHDAAHSLAADLTADHLYVDLNSVSPATKRQIAAAIGSGAGRFVEGAIMAPVSSGDHRVPILLNGAWASELRTVLSPYRMRLDVMDGPTGAAAAVKMCRSIVIKGMEALMVDFTLASERAGVMPAVLESLKASYPGMDWESVAKVMMSRVKQHGIRRAAEMREASRMINELGLDGSLASAIADRQESYAKEAAKPMGLADRKRQNAS